MDLTISSNVRRRGSLAEFSQLSRTSKVRSRRRCASNNELTQICMLRMHSECIATRCQRGVLGARTLQIFWRFARYIDGQGPELAGEKGGRRAQRTVTERGRRVECLRWA